MPWALNQFQFYFVKSYFRKGKHSNIHICLNLSFTCQYFQGSRAGKMDCELLLRLLPNEYKCTMNNIKILARSNILAEQQLKANFVVNICDKDHAEEIVKNFGKVNGSNFRQPRKANRRQSFFGTRFVCCRKKKDQRSSKVADGVGQGRRSLYQILEPGSRNQVLPFLDCHHFGSGSGPFRSALPRHSCLHWLELQTQEDCPLDSPHSACQALAHHISSLTFFSMITEWLQVLHPWVKNEELIYARYEVSVCLKGGKCGVGVGLLGSQKPRRCRLVLASHGELSALAAT